ncbi:HAD hydrolase-like protein, partial [Klebsiella pneumoniae]|nr:HAD hydrolase-like protein [Klebsiella pneumoniae]
MSLKTELVIFDWDGTLYNSVGQIVASLQHAAEQHELPLSDEAAKSIIGLGLPEVMQTLF